MPETAPCLGELDDHVIKIVLQFLGARDRRAAACTCRRWDHIVRGLQTGLVIEQPLFLKGGPSASLLPALSRRPHIHSLRWDTSCKEDVEWQAFICGAMAPRLLRLHLCCSGPLPIPMLSLPWLECMTQLQDLVLERCVACVPSEVSSFRHLTRLVVACLEVDLNTPTYLGPAIGAGFGSLRVLWLEHIYLELGAGAGACLHTLESLTLHGCLLADGVLSAFEHLTGLTLLNLRGSVLDPPIDDQGQEVEEGRASWEELPGAALRSLHVLSLDCCGLQHLPAAVVQHCSALRVLSCLGNGLDPEQPLRVGPYLAGLEALAIDHDPLLPWLSFARGEVRQHPAPNLRLVVYPQEPYKFNSLVVTLLYPAGPAQGSFTVLLERPPPAAEWIAPSLGLDDPAAYALFRTLCLMQRTFEDSPDSVRYETGH